MNTNHSHCLLVEVLTPFVTMHSPDEDTSFFQISTWIFVENQGRMLLILMKCWGKHSYTFPLISLLSPQVISLIFPSALSADKTHFLPRSQWYTWLASLSANLSKKRYFCVCTNVSTPKYRWLIPWQNYVNKYQLDYLIRSSIDYREVLITFTFHSLSSGY